MHFQKDRSGFPMILIEKIGAYIHYLPVTKIQVERFACSVDRPDFDAAWYEELVRLNPRTSSTALNDKNLFGVWASGVLPAEAEAFCEWSAPAMRLPTHAEWMEAYFHLRQLPAQPVDWAGALPGLDPRTAHLLGHLPASRHANLAEQMYLRNGVFEFVELQNRDERWGGAGYVPLEIHSHTFNPDLGTFHAPRSPESQRRSYYGFRALIPAS